MGASRPAPCPDDDGTAGAAVRLFHWWEARLFRLERERGRLTRQGAAGGTGSKEVRDVDAEIRKGWTKVELYRWLHATRSH